ncbi:hypothetical protein Ndes2526A_g00878 [Nannochloris sp. 'desiccata']
MEKSERVRRPSSESPSMPKRRTDDVDPESRTDSGVELKSRSGRLVKPKVYNDGTVALMDGKGHLEESLLNDDLKTRYAHFDDLEDGDLSDISEGSYGSTRTRSARGANNLQGLRTNTRPSRRTATRPPRAPNSTHATGYGGGGVFKQAAVEILRSECRLMPTGEIAKLALRRGLVRCTGKTPEATMASALYTDIKRKEGHSLFVRPREGLFGLREWIDEGVIQITPAQQPHLNTHVPLPSAHHLHFQSQHHNHAAAMDSGNGTGTTHHSQYFDGEQQQQQQPGASQDSGDRLMELLCAAEEINRDEMSPSCEQQAQEEEGADYVAGGEEKALTMNQQEEEMEAKVEEETNAEEHEELDEEEQIDEEATNAGHHAAMVASVFEERHASTTLPAAPHTVTLSPASAVKAAELEVQKLERLHGATHPEVGLGYLHLAKIYMSASSMPLEMKTGAEVVLQKAQDAMNAYQQAFSRGINKNATMDTNAVNAPSSCNDKGIQMLPGTATKSKQRGFFVPIAPVKLGVANNPDKTPAGPPHGGPVAAPTPLAMEEPRGWTAGPFSAVPPSLIAPSVQAAAVAAVAVAPTHAAPAAAHGVASDTENDADVEMCLPAPRKLNGGKRLPLHTVAAPLTAT